MAQQQYNPNLIYTFQGTPDSNPPQNPSQQPWITKGDIGGVAFDIEFNDSVLSLQGWNNSRYNGARLLTQNINQYTDGDVALNKTIGIQQYTRNIYLGTVITNLDNSDDPNLVDFPGMSYLGIGAVATIDVDNSIENNTFYGVPDYVKTGFYRSFFDDFPVGENLSIQLLDQTVPNFLQDTYNVYFNEGRLREQFKMVNAAETDIAINVSNDGFFQYGNPADTTGESLSGKQTITVNEDLAAVWASDTSAPTDLGDLDNLFDDLLLYKNNSYSDRDRAVFITLTNRENFLDFNYSFDNRRAFRTYEISRRGANNSRKIQLNDKFGISATNTDYGGIGSTQRSYRVSLLDTSNPSLLIKLSASDLPSGFGSAPFLIIPHNLHPFIKDNLGRFGARLKNLASGIEPPLSQLQFDQLLDRRNFNLR